MEDIEETFKTCTNYKDFKEIELKTSGRKDFAREKFFTSGLIDRIIQKERELG